MDNRMPLSRTIVENHAKIVLVRLVYLKKCKSVLQYLLYYKLPRYKNIASVKYFLAKARMGNMTEIHNEEIELNVDVTLTDPHKRNFNGN